MPQEMAREWIHNKRPPCSHSILWCFSSEFLQVILENSLCDSIICDGNDISVLQQCFGFDWCDIILAIDFVFPSTDVHITSENQTIYLHLDMANDFDCVLPDCITSRRRRMRSRPHHATPQLRAFQICFLGFLFLLSFCSCRFKHYLMRNNYAFDCDVELFITITLH